GGVSLDDPDDGRGGGGQGGVHQVVAVSDALRLLVLELAILGEQHRQQLLGRCRVAHRDASVLDAAGGSAGVWRGPSPAAPGYSSNEVVADRRSGWRGWPPLVVPRHRGRRPRPRSRA